MVLAALAPVADASGSFEQLRQAMVDSQLRVTKVTDEAVIRSMRRVPREQFVPAGREAIAYADEDVPMGKGRVLMQPVVLARLLSAFSPRYGDRALVVGAGLGYASAVLADIGLAVVAVESDAGLAAQAKEKLTITGYPHVTVVAADAAAGHAAGAPYNLILIDGAAEHIPDALVQQLGDDGAILGVLIENGVGRGIVGRKSRSGGFGTSSFMDAVVPVLTGFENPKRFTF